VCALAGVTSLAPLASLQQLSALDVSGCDGVSDGWMALAGLSLVSLVR
jgi:hypothetical protein